MLEVKNLTKTYKMTGGVAVKALDGITLSFPETGMVFLLGKSGSGKSTLLNVCGGLDAPDSGEIIIKGRSSKDFSTADFDSYRNTYVGFIFQEYNILNEFTVEDNIALALELQGKPKDKQRINELLQEVELTNFAKRKPNTLSGGQKQRVAIARALVKNPEVIMADEPTGALDSNTGKQVFDTLKQLSKQKLVLVVSHDREFAEQYGDRIIELKDGKVISDIVKTTEQAKQISDTINLIGEDTIVIPKGSSLSEQDLKKINSFLSQTEGDLIISRNSRDNTAFKKVAKITDNNGKESFETIKQQPQQKQYTKEESKFINSKLPLRHAVKIGASNIKAKPVRFTFTILLSIMSFIMFGLFSCVMFFDAMTVTSASLVDSNSQYVMLQKQYQTTSISMYDNYEGTYTSQTTTDILQSDYNKLKEKYDKVIPVYNVANGIIINNLTFDMTEKFYSNELTGAVDGENLPYIIGRAPKGEEIAISSFLFDCLKNGTVTDENGNTVTVTDDNILSTKLSINNTFLKVSGVYQCQTVDTDKFNQKMDSETAQMWQQVRTLDFYSYIAVNKTIGEKLFEPNPVSFSKNAYLDFKQNYPQLQYGDYNIDNYDNIGVSNTITYYDIQGNVSREIPSKGVVIYLNYYIDLLNNVLNNYQPSEDESEKQAYEQAVTSFNTITNNYTVDYQGFQQDFKTVNNFVKQYIDSNFKITYKIFDKEMTVVGVTSNNIVRFNNTEFDNIINIAKENGINYTINATEYSPNSDDKAQYYGVLIDIQGMNTNEVKALMNDTTTPHQYSLYTYNNFIISTVGTMAYTISMISSVFLWVGVALAVLAMLLLFNFISVSVANKKREIGILRAVGARGFDVFKIFFSEASIVVLICSVVSLIATAILSSYINSVLSAQLSNTMTLLVFNGVSIAMIVGIAVLTAIIATFLPVYNASRRKPVETIRSN